MFWLGPIFLNKDINVSMLKKITSFVLVLMMFSLSGYADIYDFGPLKKEGKAFKQDMSLVKIRLKEKPGQSSDFFIYNIDRVNSPRKLSNKELDNAVFLLEKGNLYFSRKDYNKAVSYYKKSLKINPLFISALNNLGAAYFILGEYEKSIPQFESIIKIEPLDGYAYFYLGRIYKKLNNYRKAGSYLNTAMNIFQDGDKQYLVKEIEGLLEQLKVIP